MKRIFDFSISLIGLIILIPVFIVIALLIKLDDKGPIFFRQKRVGKNGKLFTLYKFRSMRVAEFFEEGRFDAGNTSSITKTGKFLRNYKIDEFPQLLNVIKGDMSLVGPRPEVEKWVAVYSERWKLILSVRPGITDNSSIIYKNEEALLAESDDPERKYREIILPKKLDFYEDYVHNNSFYSDLKLIVKTILSVYFK